MPLSLLLRFIYLKSKTGLRKVNEGCPKEQMIFFIANFPPYFLNQGEDSGPGKSLSYGRLPFTPRHWRKVRSTL
jgi:hypothetical protein